MLKRLVPASQRQLSKTLDFIGDHMEFIDFFKKNRFNWTNTYAASGGDAWLSHKYEVSPEDFLSFAEKDLKLGGTHGLVNSITNSKRAVDCQTDNAISCLGYDLTTSLPETANLFIDKFQNENGKMESTQSLKLLHSLDIVPSGLINEMRKSRHDLEHRYKAPSEKDVRNFLDLAKLFIRSTEYVLKLFPDDWVLVDTEYPGEKTNILRIEYPYKANIFKLSFKKMKHDANFSHQEGWRSEVVDELNIDNESPLFLPIAALNVVNSVDGYIQPKLAQMVSVFSDEIPKEKILFKGYIDEPL